MFIVFDCIEKNVLYANHVLEGTFAHISVQSYYKFKKNCNQIKNTKSLPPFVSYLFLNQPHNKRLLRLCPLTWQDFYATLFIIIM